MMKPVYVRELEVIYKKRCAPRDAVLLRSFTKPKLVHEAFRFIASYPKEVFLCLLLDGQCHVLGYETVSIGSEGSTPVVASCAFRAAVNIGAAKVIFLHNHPGGSVRPSSEDEQTTKKLIEAGRILGIQVLDHLIIGDEVYTSLQELGYFNNSNSIEER